MSKTLPVNFQIRINSQEEWNTAWAKLQEMGYKLTPNHTERSFRGFNTVIKHSTNLNYVWTSGYPEGDYKTQYVSFEEFARRNGVKMEPEPTMADVRQLMQLDRSTIVKTTHINDLKARITATEAQLAAREAELATHFEKIATLQRKFGIKF